MTDSTGHMNRPGAGPRSSSLYMSGIPLNVYINHNAETGRVEIAKPMPPGELDALVKDFPSEAAAREWAREEFNAGKAVGTTPSLNRAMGFVPDARRIRQWRVPSIILLRGTAGWSTSIWKSSLTELTTTD